MRVCDDERLKPDAGLRLAQAVAGAADAPTLDRFFERRRRLIRPRIAERLLDKSREQLRVDFNRSLTLARCAEHIATRLGEERLRALSLRAMANALSVGGNNQAAVGLHEEAMAVFEQIAANRRKRERSVPRSSR